MNQKKNLVVLAVSETIIIEPTNLLSQSPTDRKLGTSLKKQFNISEAMIIEPTQNDSSILQLYGTLKKHENVSIKINYARLVSIGYIWETITVVVYYMWQIVKSSRVIVVLFSRMCCSSPTIRRGVNCMSLLHEMVSM